MRIRSIASLGVATGFFFYSTTMFASAFQSFEQNSSDLGTAYAGTAAIADDATTEFSNPAGMTRIKKPEVAVSTVVVNAHSHFTATENKSQGHEILNTANKTTDEPLGTNPMPAFHMVIPRENSRFVFGYGLTVPFGLSTHYSKHGPARYFGTDSQLEMFNFGTSMAYRFTHKLSLGIGIDVGYLNAELDQQLDLAGLSSPGQTNQAFDASVENSANAMSMGANVGLLYEFSPATRFGLTYRSPMRFNLSGFSHVKYPPIWNRGRPVTDSFISATIVMPDVTTASIFHSITPKWDVMGSVIFTHWRWFQNLKMHFSNSLGTTVIPEHFHNTFRYSIGTAYQVTPKFKLRAGVAYDGSPTNDHWRTIRLPDASRIWGAVGMQYIISPNWAVDFAYAYVHIGDGSVHQIQPMNGHNDSISGYYRHNYANLIGLQVTAKL